MTDYLIISFVVSLFAGIFILKSCLVYITEQFSLRKFRKENVIAIAQSSSINLTTYLKFIEDFKSVDKNKDINLVIQTIGGDLTSTEGICNCILTHKGSGKIKCYIPNYAFSAGLMIALCCNEIILTNASIVCPCDGQMNTKNDFTCSSASINYMIKYKMKHNEPIKEDWLISNYEAIALIKRQKKFFQKLCEAKSYLNEQFIYNELFSGKYNHDTAFTSSDLKNIDGLNVIIIETIPQIILDMLDYKIKL